MNRKFLFLVLVFVLGGGAMIFQATRAGAAPVMMPSDLVGRDTAVPRIRVAGRVSAGTEIDYVMSPKAVLRFSIEDPKHPERGHVPVVYEGVRPDMFAIGRDVIIDGSFGDGRITAATLLTQCPSKYEAPDPEKFYREQQQQKSSGKV
jgi:cytochrome c-type biogenesis protein CcmE